LRATFQRIRDKQNCKFGTNKTANSGLIRQPGSPVVASTRFACSLRVQALRATLEQIRMRFEHSRVRCRAIMAHIRQPTTDSGLGLQVQVLKHSMTWASHLTLPSVRRVTEESNSPRQSGQFTRIVRVPGRRRPLLRSCAPRPPSSLDQPIYSRAPHPQLLCTIRRHLTGRHFE
jgi:hypothetical protein